MWVASTPLVLREESSVYIIIMHKVCSIESWTFPETVQVWMASSVGSGVDQRLNRKGIN